MENYETRKVTNRKRDHSPFETYLTSTYTWFWGKKGPGKFLGGSLERDNKNGGGSLQTVTRSLCMQGNGFLLSQGVQTRFMVIPISHFIYLYKCSAGSPSQSKQGLVVL